MGKDRSKKKGRKERMGEDRSKKSVSESNFENANRISYLWRMFCLSKSYEQHHRHYVGQTKKKKQNF